jgi:D-alanyl-D-alanine dipeptidase
MTAEAVAGQNGVHIESLEGGTTVDVVVSIGGASAAASADLNRSGWEGLDPSMLTALRVAEAHLGERLVVISGLRTRAEQARLWANRGSNPFPVAPPGTSRHEAGLAIDVSIDTAVRLADVAGQAGLCRPLPVADPVHFIVC